MDREQQPLCLLHSVVFEGEIELDMPLHWRAGNLCAELFRPQLAEPEHAATILTQHINDLTGDPATARWFMRKDDGVANALAAINTMSAAPGTHAAEHFPDFFIREQHVDPALTALAEAFLQWQAP